MAFAIYQVLHSENHRVRGQVVDSVSSQARYHTALRKLHGDRIELIEGYYSVNKMKVKIVDAEEPDKAPRDCHEILAWKVEEKQSDVNLALHAYHDAISGEIDHAVIVTNDTDIAPALSMIRTHTKVRIGVVVPTTDHTRLPNTDLAIPVRGSKASAFKWMEQPNPHVDNQRPIELIETIEGANRVLVYMRNWITQQAQLGLAEEKSNA